MSFSERYPLTHRDAVRRLQEVLGQVPGLSPRDREDLAVAINNMADKACDLDDIFRQLVERDPPPDEVAELLTAFELTTEQIRGDSDSINGRLYDLADRLRKALPSSQS